MAYNRHVWVPEEIIMDYNLNNMEEGIVNEETRAIEAESTLASKLQSEITRATNSENTISASVTAEVTRATNAEDALSTNLATEITRATSAETSLNEGLDSVRTSLAYKISTSEKGNAGGVAELDDNGKVPSSQLPSYVDDVVEGHYSGGKFYADTAHKVEIEGEIGKIYVDLESNLTYRWGGSAFVEISKSLALGETSSTAYRGDRGAAAYKAMHTHSNKSILDSITQDKIDQWDAGGSGHTILDTSGTSLTQRDNLQFSGFPLLDDSTNDRTIVSLAKSYSTLSEAQADIANIPEGGIVFVDED